MPSSACPAVCPSAEVAIRNVRGQSNHSKNTIQGLSQDEKPAKAVIENGYYETDTSENRVDVTASPQQDSKATIVNHDSTDNGSVNVVAY